MKMEVKATVVTAESKPYSVNGNEGVSHKVRLNIEGEIFPCKSTAEQVASLVAFKGTEGMATIDVQSRREALSIVLVGFVVKGAK